MRPLWHRLVGNGGPQPAEVIGSACGYFLSHQRLSQLSKTSTTGQKVSTTIYTLPPGVGRRPNLDPWGTRPSGPAWNKAQLCCILDRPGCVRILEPFLHSVFSRYPHTGRNPVIFRLLRGGAKIKFLVTIDKKNKAHRSKWIVQACSASSEPLNLLLAYFSEISEIWFQCLEFAPSGPKWR